MMYQVIFVALGGALGSVLRYLVGRWLQNSCVGSFPLSTWLVNVLGCALIGFFSVLFDKHFPSNTTTKLLLTTGFCGGFTTFSTFCNENIGLLRDGRLLLAGFYTITSIVVGLLGVYAGFKLAQQL